MIKYILTGFLILSMLASCTTQKKFSQEKEDQRIEAVNFPTDWVGRWTGDLKIYSGLGLQSTLRMELIIEPIRQGPNHTFTIVYDDGTEVSKRNYELITVDKDQGLFLVDEKNSILIESYFIGGKWFQRFDVAGSLLFCTIEMQHDRLVWEITSGKTEPISTTGDTKEEGIYEVNTMPVGVYQRAVLSKF